MTRYGENFIIIKQDLKDGFVKIREYKGLVEYWIYQAKKSYIFKLDGGKARLRNIDDAKLSCIIACDNHFKKELENTILIKGFKFTEKDLDDYLKKTKRGLNG